MSPPSPVPPAGLSWFGRRKKALLRWGNARVWHRWPVIVRPLVKDFRRYHGYAPHIFRPRTLSEKVLHRMLFDRRKHLHVLSGKLESRGFAQRRTGSDQCLVPLVACIRNPAELREVELPEKFVMKASRGSEMTYIHRGEVPPDIHHLERLCDLWLKDQFPRGTLEWCYEHAEDVVLIEELLLDENGKLPVDYKIFCFDGIPRYIRTCEARFSDQVTNIFLTPEWVPLEDQTPYFKPALAPPPRPPHLAEMLELAATLSRGTDMLRVDLYDVGGKVYLGELTNTPSRAMMPYPPFEFDLFLGSFWKVDTRTPLEL
ncbi:TupA-like ATPgrasp [Bryocella elongata]|uniref:TupA-like ATPgrasp n=1 Tax=Bryocella elongata TaxID=863522 RepID=A0A1H5YC28_9BACT|nr:ATP-grasp fold amidoligase family protein [Bryocella elongata]SEG21548.1 TupA-like ATPgrasp [Bryocella elongata]